VAKDAKTFRIAPISLYQTARAARGTPPAPASYPGANREAFTMDQDRINGAADQAKGAVKEAAGKVTGDTKLKVEGQLDKAKGQVESAVGKTKDEIRKN
jgi:uncharacterized protein YjbJ (UPF0337 family)